MRIAIAGRYSAPTESERRANLEHLREVAAQVNSMGHETLIGLDEALPEVARLGITDPAARYEHIMRISLEVVSRCDALLLASESPGALRELELMQSMGKPIYRDLKSLPRGDDRG